MPDVNRHNNKLIRGVKIARHAQKQWQKYTYIPYHGGTRHTKTHLPHPVPSAPPRATSVTSDA